MKVIRAEKAGACYGVQRAIDIAEDTLKDKGATSTLGSLIHNPKVILDLERKGLAVCEHPDDIKTTSVIIRSHGITPDAKRCLTARGLELIDATCPHVLRAQKAAEELAHEGFEVIVIGEEGHPEVEGLRAYALDQGAKVHVIIDPHKLPDNLPSKVGIVVQTTQTKNVLDDVLSYLDGKGIDYVLKDTICSATIKRQDAAFDLAGEVDAMVVIGGRNSSNTTRLAEICSSVCDKTLHIEGVEELDPSYFKDASTIGVSAGASTPEDQIEQVVSYLEAL